MANPLPYEDENYETIKKNKFAVPREVWKLIAHHIGNDVNIIQLIIGSHTIGPDSEPIPLEDAKKILNHCDAIRRFLSKLRKNIEITK